jgi:hypothetical protein
MENNLQQFENVPNSFLTEISETEFLNDVKKTDEAPKEETPIEEIKTEFSDIESGTGSTSSSDMFGPKVSLDNFLSDELGTELYDAIVTAICITALNTFGIESTKSEMSFTAKEKSVLKPIIKECISNLNIKFTNPFEALAWTTLLLVGTKIITTKGEQIAEKIKGKPALKKAIKKEQEIAKDKKPLSKYMQKKLENEKNAKK